MFHEIANRSHKLLSQALMPMLRSPGRDIELFQYLFLSCYHKLISCCQVIPIVSKPLIHNTSHSHTFICCGNQILSYDNEMLSRGNEILNSGNKIISGYDKIVNPCLHSYPALIKSFPPLTY